MKLFHTADWHLGKLVQSVYMTEDQQYVLEQFVNAVQVEKPDAVIIAGDLYDRAVPPTEAIELLNQVLDKIVLEFNIPVLAIAGNHDSPSRLKFGSNMLRAAGYHIVGEWTGVVETVILSDRFGEVHFHLLPYVEPSKVRHLLEDEQIKTHDDAMKAIIATIRANMDKAARHIFIGHAFVTPNGEVSENTSDAERPLSIGGVEQVNAAHFDIFHYTALGHLHQAHYAGDERVRYAGSPLKYSISEEHHNKGFYIVELDEAGLVSLEKRELKPRRDMRTVEGFMEEIEQHPIHEDYVFVHLLDETPVLSPMERIRAVYPNAMHVERQVANVLRDGSDPRALPNRARMDDVSLFRAFYLEVKGTEASLESEKMMMEVLQEITLEEGERNETVKNEDDRIRTL